MSFSAAQRQAMLNGVSSLAYLSLHSAWPGAGGANEISLTRPAIPWGSATDGEKRRAAAVAVTLPGGNAVAWLGVWSAQSGGSFVARAPVGGHPLEFHLNIPQNRIVIPGTHNWTDGTRIVFFGATPPAPLVEGTDYWLRDAQPDSFRVASVPGGTAIVLTAEAATGCVVSDREQLAATGSAAIVTVPQLFLRFRRNYDPEWTGSATITIDPGSTFDLNTICTDRNGDTLSYSLNAASAPLPTGVTLATNGILSCAANAPPATLTGVIFDADDGVGD